jgi:hypothetical protein
MGWDKFRKIPGGHWKFLFTKTSGVDVMITILFDFSQFSAKKLAFSLNTNVMITFLNLALF